MMYDHLMNYSKEKKLQSVADAELYRWLEELTTKELKERIYFVRLHDYKV